MEKRVYECPFCDSEISKEKYEQVIRENEILKKKIEGLEKERNQLREKEKLFEEEKKKLKLQVEEEKKKLKLQIEEEKKKLLKQNEQVLAQALNKQREKYGSDIAKFQETIKRLKEGEIKHKEEIKKVKSDELIKRAKELEKYEGIMKKQQEEIERLKKGKTAQELGFDFENDMYDILKKEFPDDEVEKTGKKGDVIIRVKTQNGIVGVILIECKKTEKHSPSHIDEVKRHKIDAKADVGILVTNGDFGKAKMDGFRNIDDVLIIRPLSAVDFIRHIRKGLIQIDSLKLSKEEKNKEMQKLWNFIHSQEFESQMNSILREINNLQEADNKEMDLIEKRKKIEENLLKAHKLISEGILNSKKRE